MCFDETAEFVRGCAQVYWKPRNFSNDLKNHKRVVKVEFDQSMYGPDANEWPGSPVGFSWDVEVLLLGMSEEETYTFEVLYETGWSIYAERSSQGDHGLETQSIIIDSEELSICECTEQLIEQNTKGQNTKGHTLLRKAGSRN